MARIVLLEGKKPHMLELGGEKKFICTCGLSKNFPLCDGAHKATEDEEDGKLYSYMTGKRQELQRSE